jgi:phenylacetate-CoA ligase
MSRHDAWRRFKLLQQNQWLPYEQIAELHWRKLKDLLVFAQREIPFYHDLWREHDVDVRRFTVPEDMASLPVVTKKDLIAGVRDSRFPLPERGEYQMVQTSGTTGPRFQIPLRLEDFQQKYASYLRQHYVTGWRLGLRSAALHYSGHMEFAGRYSGRDDRDTHVAIKRLAYRFAHRRRLLKPYWERYSGNDSFACAWYEELRRWRPYLLETMDFNIIDLANYIEENDLPPLSIPKMIVLGTLNSGLLERLQRLFSTEIFDRYGPHEIEGVAFACSEHRGMHIAHDAVRVEFLDDNYRAAAPMEVGHVVLTDLDTRLMPLIRYQIGDLGFFEEEPCRCGRGFPLMGELEGRTIDLFELKTGRKVPPARVNAVLQDEPAVKLFQVVQHADNTISVNIVPDQKRYSETARQRVTKNLVELLGPDEQMSINLVDKVQLEPNGKVSFSKRSAANRWSPLLTSNQADEDYIQGPNASA